MLNVFIGLFMVLHGLVHGLYSGQSVRLFELRPGMGWPDGSWAFSKIFSEKAVRALASILFIIAGLGFVTGGIFIFIKQPFWRPVVMSSSLFSSILFILFWDGKIKKLAELKMYGLSSASKHPTLTEHGAIPIDYRTQDFAEKIRQTEPKGLDFVFNGMGPEYFKTSLMTLHRGGILVHYGAPQSFGGFLRLLVKLITHNLIPNGKKIKGYGTHREGVETFKEDWTALFDLLKDGKIRPIIAKRFPLLKAPKAYELLESGSVTGNVVLLAQELFKEQSPKT